MTLVFHHSAAFIMDDDDDAYFDTFNVNTNEGSRPSYFQITS